MTNRIVLENERLDGVTDRSYWDVAHTTAIEGFTTDISVNAGGTVDFKINVNNGAETDYKVEIFRLGFYGGAGGREVAEWTNTNAVDQALPLYDASRGLVDAGNWVVTDSWDIPADAVSGVYLARVQRLDANGNPIEGEVNQIPFIVRNDGVAADIVLQTSDTTWQAYNGWAGELAGNARQSGENFYGNQGTLPGNTFIQVDDPNGFAQDRAYAVSYNRPLITRNVDGQQGGAAAGAQDYLFGADYAAIHWLEQNGYNVTYISGVDTDRLGTSWFEDAAGNNIRKAFISVGHDEYWSGDQRINVESARDSGVNLMFWSGNEVYWKTRYEDGQGGGSNDYRTLVCYKETWANLNANAGPDDYANIDPSNVWTGTWRDTRFWDAVQKDANGNVVLDGNGQPIYIAGGQYYIEGGGAGNEAYVNSLSGLRSTCNCAENSLTGTLFGPDGTGERASIDVPSGFGSLRIWRNTSIAAPGDDLALSDGILGYEWNTIPEDELRPAGQIQLSQTIRNWSSIVVDDGNVGLPGTATHALSLYRAESGALVFGAGTVFWSWGLSDEHDSSPYGGNIENTAIKQFTVNMFADMGIQPGVSDAILLSQGLVRAAMSNDFVAGTATISDIAATVEQFSTVVITGSATDDDGNALTVDGAVASVEVSLDGGQTWRVAQTANGWATWSFVWTPAVQGTYTILARAIDDSLNIATITPSQDVVIVTAPSPPEVFGLFRGGFPVTGILFNDNSAVELGMRFSVSAPGTIEELRYWRTAADANDTDIRQGHLWRADGTLLATVTFTSAPGASGWQIAQLAAPVGIAAGVGYVVSYRTNDNYFAGGNFFAPGNEVAFDGLDNGAFTDPFGFISANESTAVSGNGLFRYGSGAAVMPNESFQGANYWVDISFNPTEAVNNTPPVFTSSASLSAAENQVLAGTVSATDAESNALTFAIAGGADAARFSINTATGVLRFLIAPDHEAPSDADSDNVYDLTVSVSDGIAQPALQNVSVAVTDVTETPGLGSRLFGASDLPAATETGDSTDYELGMRFVSGQSGIITELRYFRGEADAGDTDTRTLSLWDAAANRLRVVSLSSLPGEFGWQVGTLSAPVAILANTVYVVSYGTIQNYSFTSNYFGVAHSGTDGVLTAPGGNNGVFAAGSTGVFPTLSFNSTNYWVDVTFDAVAVVDTPPVFTSPSGFILPENGTLAGVVTATDTQTAVLGYSISGGADAALFAIDPLTGRLSLIAPPDFEQPGDAGADNVYDVTVQVSDGALTATQAIAVTVANVADAPPVITSNGGGATAAIALAENGTAVTTVTATDADNPGVLGYAIVGGADAALFAIDPLTGILSLIAAPDFELPADAGADNVYDVTVQVSDGTLTDTQTIAVTVTDLADAPPVITSDGGGAAAAITLAENGQAVTTVTATDADTPGALGYSISGGADAALFAIDPLTGILSLIAPPDFELPADAGADNVYDVTVRVSDGTNTDTQAIAVTVTNLADAAPVITSNGGAAVAAISLAENGSAVTTVTAIDPDNLAVPGYAIIGGADAALFAIDPLTGILALIVPPDFEQPSDAGADNVYDVTVQVSDGTSTDTQAIAVTVTNVVGVTINGTSAANTVDALVTVSGQPRPTDENDTINGSGGNDTLSGLGGDDLINGGSGSDRMTGGSGNDSYVVDSTLDIVNEAAGSGTDLVRSSVTFSLTASTVVLGSVENLTLTGTGNINGTGNALGNTIVGSSGNNVLAGLGGADILSGGGGFDTASYAASGFGVSVSLTTGTGQGGDAAGDTLVGILNLTGSNFNDTLEGDAAGNLLSGGAGLRDLVTYANALAGVTVSLATTLAQNTVGSGNDRLNGFEDLSGSSLNDALTGSSGANILSGLGGDDRITGGSGADTLLGGAGGDTFIFAATTDSSATGSDLIADFDQLLDTIDISLIDANSSLTLNQAFLYAGQTASVVSRSLSWFESGGNTIIQADTNGVSTSVELRIVLAGTGLGLTVSDFVL